jgi:hypothetical protein
MKISSRFIQYTFFALFVLSILGSFLFLTRFERMATFVMLQSISTGETENLETDLTALRAEQSIGVTTSIVTTLISLAGFIVSTTFNVRKDKREALESELALKQKEIELQRALIELEELKKKTDNM